MDRAVSLCARRVRERPNRSIEVPTAAPSGPPTRHLRAFRLVRRAFTAPPDPVCVAERSCAFPHGSLVGTGGESLGGERTVRDAQTSGDRRHEATVPFLQSGLRGGAAELTRRRSPPTCAICHHLAGVARRSGRPEVEDDAAHGEPHDGGTADRRRGSEVARSRESSIPAGRGHSRAPPLHPLRHTNSEVSSQRSRKPCFTCNAAGSSRSGWRAGGRRST